MFGSHRDSRIRKHTLKILKDIFDREHEEVLFPLLIPEDELAKEAIHVKGFEEEVYWVTHGGLTELNEKLALRPTSETAMYPMFSLWVRNHSDLPMKYYQVVNTFRYETKHTRPLIRVREITTFKEAHTVHATAEETEEQVKEALKIYREFFDSLGIPYTVSKRPEWDKFPGAEYTMAFDTLMPDNKTLQIGTVHNLGQTFAKTFDIKFETAEGEHEYVYQTCYGLSDRVIASVIGVHGDDAGLSLPPNIAPYQVVIVPIIFKKGGEAVIDFCRNLAEKLVTESNLRVYFDDRDIRAGKKYYEWEMRGVPLRLEVGPRDIENKKIVTFRRDTKEKEVIDYDDTAISSTAEKLLEEIKLNMRENAWKSLESNVHNVDSIEEAAKQMSGEGGIVTFNWCGDEDCGKEIEEKVNVDILGVQADTDVGTCINCGKQSKHLTLIAKTY